MYALLPAGAACEAALLVLTWLVGWRQVTQAQFEALALAQVTELWTRFGALNEIWFDGGYTSDMEAQLKALLAKHQPKAIGYNGGGISSNPARWSKTEGDVPPGGPDVWSTACGDVDWGAGSPPENCTDSGKPALFYPSGTDYTLQSGDTWFYEPPLGDKEHPTHTPLRTLDELIYTYHQVLPVISDLLLLQERRLYPGFEAHSSCHGWRRRWGTTQTWSWTSQLVATALCHQHTPLCTSASATGSDPAVSANHAPTTPDLYVRLKYLCHIYLTSSYVSLRFSHGAAYAADGPSNTTAATSLGHDARASAVTVTLASHQVFDRVVLQEDQTRGQQIRGWRVEWLAAGTSGTNWTLFGSGRSIGNKRIVIAPGAMSHNASKVRLTITETAGVSPAATLLVPTPCGTGSLDTLTKLGTEDIGMTETTPVVWEGELYRFESVRSGHWNNSLNCTNTSPGQGRRCQSYLRFRRQSGSPSWLTGEVVTAPFGLGWGLACAIVDDDGAGSTGGKTIHAFASQEGRTVGRFSSDALTPSAKWEFSVALTLPAGFTAFNTAVARGKLPDGSAGYAMLIEVRMPGAGGFQIIVALSKTLAGPWQLNNGSSSSPAATPPPHPPPPCAAPGAAGYCEAVHATPTHSSAGVLTEGAWPAPTYSAALQAVAKLCSANASFCAAFGMGSDARSEHSYQMYTPQPTVLHPLFTPDWNLYYRNATCCKLPPPPPVSHPSRVFGPGSCPALRYDVASGYWHMLYTPNPTVKGGGYRTWQIYAARSRTLASGSWEHSPLNPIMEADAHDRRIHNTAIPAEERGWAANTTNLNDSDPDLVEFEGHVLLVGNWGDQRTTPTNSLFQAVFNGSIQEFWASLYDPGAFTQH